MQEFNVVKRNGKKVVFEQDKIENVIERVLMSDDDVIERDIDQVFGLTLERILDSGKDVISTEEINDFVERSFMDSGFYDEAKSFILYREQNKNIRKMSVDNGAMSEYIFTNRYSRYLPRKRRRETWNESVDRVRDMHLKRYPQLEEEINWSFEQVRQKRVLPSMRSLQFGGDPIEKNHSRIYNCSYGVADRIDFFGETMFLLMCGCGVGFSVEYDNVNKLPSIQKPSSQDVRHIKIADSIEGWSDAVKEIMRSYIEGYTVEFIYSKIRNEGSKIRSGGKAPGHIPLRRAIEKVRTILEGSVERKLRPIEVYDIVMHISDAVLSGGVRRSATICLFSPEDDEMMNAKTGTWFEENPQRARSNNSVKLDRETTTRDQFMRIFEKQREFGEPGFLFVSNQDMGVNPCCEISLNPYLEKGYTLSDGTVLEEKTSGFAFCNLTTINGAMLTTLGEMMNAVKAATIIGTCQSGFTDFTYLSNISKEICDREALLGVSITGMMDSPDVALNPEYQTQCAKYAIEINQLIADKIGVKHSARLTCVKPEGTSSILLNTASGIHPRHAKKYFRRIQANVNDPVYLHFKEKNPHCCEPSVWSSNGRDDVITFCVKSPDGAITKDDLTALEFLEIVKSTQENWVRAGTAIPESSKGFNHNVSNTVTFKTDEAQDVADFIYDNREFFTGVSLIPDDNNLYQQAPHQQIETTDDESHWANLIESYEKIDYTMLNEDDDITDHKSIVVCSGGSCDISLNV